jgi:hypothetical protein
MITYINSIIDNFIKYAKINRSIQKKIIIIDEKIKTIKKYEGIYDLGLSHTNLLFKKTMLNNFLTYRLMNLKSCLTKFYTDNYGVYLELNKLQKNLCNVLKEKNEFVPHIPKITLSEKHNKLNITEFKKWMHQLQGVIQNTKRRINLLNEKRDAFETMIENELPSIDLRKTMNLQKDDLLNDYERIKHRYISIINFSYYVTKNILKYKIHNWDIKTANSKNLLEENSRHSPISLGSPIPVISPTIPDILPKIQENEVVNHNNMDDINNNIHNYHPIHQHSPDITIEHTEDIEDKNTVELFKENIIIPQIGLDLENGGKDEKSGGNNEIASIFDQSASIMNQDVII